MLVFTFHVSRKIKITSKRLLAKFADKSLASLVHLQNMVF